MAPLSPEAFGRGWRVTAVVVACLVALGLPYFIISGLVDRGATPGLAGLTATSAPPTGTSTGSSSTTSSSEVTGAADAAAAPLDEAGESCRLASLRVSATLAAADVSLAQFDKHIDAMNLLVAGKISLAVATQFWDETRVGAVQNSTAYQRAQRALAKSRTACAALPAAVADDLPYGDVQRLNTCVGYVSAGTAALRRADTAVRTWVHHIHDMEMLRKGEITPAQATAAWKKDWHTGEKQLKTYESSRQKAASAPCALQ